MMNFSNRELTLIGDLQRVLHSHQRGCITPPELAAGLLHEVALADVDRILPHCMAPLPREARPDVEACLDRLASSDYQEILVLYVGPGFVRAKEGVAQATIPCGLPGNHRLLSAATGDRTEDSPKSSPFPRWIGSGSSSVGWLRKTVRNAGRRGATYRRSGSASSVRDITTNGSRESHLLNTEVSHLQFARQEKGPA